MSSKLRIEVRKILEEYYDFYPDFFDPLYNKNVHGFIGFKDSEGIQTVTEEEVLDEGAADFMDIPPSVGLVRNYKDSDKIWLHLFDFKTQKCFGHITLHKLSDRSYMVTSVASEQGFGPLMMEIGMMASYPAGISIDRVADTRDKVWGIFKKFSDHRNDIKTVIIKDTDMEYDGRYIQDDEEKDFLNNIILVRHPSTWYKKILERGDRLAIESGIENEFGSAYPDFISKACRGYFSDKYNT